MEQKDTKDMTASELLRLADSHPCSMCHLVMAGDESCATTGCAEWAYRLANKIDAELAQARNESLRQGAMVWAKANGWPDFKDGEDFGAWLDRCFLPRPRYEDGEPVQLGDRVLAWGEDHTVERIGIEVRGGGCLLLQYIDSPEERLERPAPEVLGADGLPLKVGEVVYSAWCGRRNPPITSVHKAGDTIDGFPAELDFVRYDDGYDWAKDLTHIPPDTQWRIDRDVHKDECEYFDHVGNCRGCPANGTGESCIESMTLDLLRRQRELDKLTGGAE